MHKILKDKTFEMKFHFIDKQNGCSVNELAMEVLGSVFSKFGEVRLYRGVIIFTSKRTFLDEKNGEQEALSFVDTLEKEVQAATNEIGQFTLVSLD